MDKNNKGKHHNNSNNNPTIPVADAGRESEEGRSKARSGLPAERLVTFCVRVCVCVCVCMYGCVYLYAVGGGNGNAFK